MQKVVEHTGARKPSLFVLDSACFAESQSSQHCLPRPLRPLDDFQRLQTACVAAFSTIMIPPGSENIAVSAQVMHAWLRLSGYGRLSGDVEEGLAQLMALLWLERQKPPAV